MFVASVKLDELIHHFGRVPIVVAESDQCIKPGHTGRETGLQLFGNHDS